MTREREWHCQDLPLGRRDSSGRKAKASPEGLGREAPGQEQSTTGKCSWFVVGSGHRELQEGRFQEKKTPKRLSDVSERMERRIVLFEWQRLINGSYVEIEVNGRHEAPITFRYNKTYLIP